MDPVVMSGILQIVKFGLESLDLFTKGDITEEELKQRYQRMQEKFNTADDLWN